MSDLFNYLIIDTSKRNTGTSTSCTISLDRNIIIKNYLHLVYAYIPITHYLMNDSTNKLTIVFSDNPPTTRAITLTNKNYDTTTLAIEIKNQIAFNGFKIKYDIDTYKYTCSTGLYNFTIKGNVNNSVNTVIGFNKDSDSSSLNLSLVSPNIIDFLSPSILYIKINDLTNKITSTKFNPHTFIVPITVAKGEVNLYYSDIMKNSFETPQEENIQNINLTINTIDYYNNNNNGNIKLIFIYN